MRALWGGDDIIERLGILQHNPVHRCYACLKRWVVHEQNNWAIGLVQFASQPDLARGAICARMGFWVFCVQQQKPPELGFKTALYKTAFVAGNLWEGDAKGCSVVVIADN
ncbi:hypothetical protein ROBYS_45450 [Roseobacter sp. OBYS 0001]|nr:hypothetical protein ROBYS_45450 [Roseobacter sp. OBYS 0001]